MCECFICTSVHGCMSGAPQRPERAPDTQELELQIIASCHVETGGSRSISATYEVQRRYFEVKVFCQIRTTLVGLASVFWEIMSVMGRRVCDKISTITNGRFILVHCFKEFSPQSPGSTGLP